MKALFASLAAFVLVLPASAQEVEQVVKKIEAKFEPADAKPGQTVTLKISVELEDGWVTYPTVQADKGAKAQTNKVTFPEKGPIVFVDLLKEPANAKTKSEEVLGIESLSYYPGGGVWERKAVVAPKTPAGKQDVKVVYRIMVCNKDNCLPPKAIDLSATLNVAGDAVSVDPKYKEIVEKQAERK